MYEDRLRELKSELRMEIIELNDEIKELENTRESPIILEIKRHKLQTAILNLETAHLRIDVR